MHFNTRTLKKSWSIAYNNTQLECCINHHKLYLEPQFFSYNLQIPHRIYNVINMDDICIFECTCYMIINEQESNNRLTKPWEKNPQLSEHDSTNTKTKCKSKQQKYSVQLNSSTTSLNSFFQFCRIKFHDYHYLSHTVYWITSGFEVLRSTVSVSSLIF